VSRVHGPVDRYSGRSTVDSLRVEGKWRGGTIMEREVEAAQLRTRRLPDGRAAVARAGDGRRPSPPVSEGGGDGPTGLEREGRGGPRMG
jgi:hypothetical protein